MKAMKKIVIMALAAMMLLASCKHADGDKGKDTDNYKPWWMESK